MTDITHRYPVQWVLSFWRRPETTTELHLTLLSAETNSSDVNLTHTAVGAPSCNLMQVGNRRRRPRLLARRSHVHHAIAILLAVIWILDSDINNETRFRCWKRKMTTVCGDFSNKPENCSHLQASLEDVPLCEVSFLRQGPRKEVSFQASTQPLAHNLLLRCLLLTMFSVLEAC